MPTLALPPWRLPRTPPVSAPVAYAVALAAPLAVFAVDLTFTPREHVPLALFFLAAFFASWLGGRGPGLVAIALSTALMAGCLLLTEEALPQAAVELGLYVLVSGLVTWLSACLREAYRAQDLLLREAQEAIRVRDEFVSVAGHELKTPLTALQLQLESLQRGVRRGAPEPDRLAERLAKAGGHARRLERLVHELLDVSRLSAGRLKLAGEQLELSGLVREVVGRLDESAGLAGSRLAVRHEGPLWCRGDRVRLEQVVSNLVGNAIKYGMGKPVEVELRGDGPHAVVEVRDQGMGIAPEDQRRIFERFERAVSAHHYGGLGLGLWIAREIVESGGGSIGVQSAPGAGSTFQVRLPRVARTGGEANAHR